MYRVNKDIFIKTRMHKHICKQFPLKKSYIQTILFSYWHWYSNHTQINTYREGEIKYGDPGFLKCHHN